MAGGLQHHPGGARHAAPAPRFALPGTAPTHRPTRLHTAQPDRTLRSVCGRSLSAAAFQPPHDPCDVAWLGDDVQQSRSVPRAPCAPRRVRDAAESAAHDDWRGFNVDPMLCGVVVELDRLSTGLGRLGGAWNSARGSVHYESEQSLANHSWNYPALCPSLPGVWPSFLGLVNVIVVCRISSVFLTWLGPGSTEAGLNLL